LYKNEVKISHNMTANSPKLWKADTMSSTLPSSWLYPGLQPPVLTPKPPCFVNFTRYDSTL
jgi:hypothetical protein